MEITQKRVRRRFFNFKRRVSEKVASTFLTASGSVILQLFDGNILRRKRRRRTFYTGVAL